MQLRGRCGPVVLIAAVCALVLGLFVAALILTSRLTSGDRAELLMIDVVGGWALFGAGAVALTRPGDRRVGVLMFAGGFAWLLAGLRWSDASGALQTSGLAAAWLWAAMLAQLALAFPGGQLIGRA